MMPDRVPDFRCLGARTLVRRFFVVRDSLELPEVSQSDLADRQSLIIRAVHRVVAHDEPMG